MYIYIIECYFCFFFNQYIWLRDCFQVPAPLDHKLNVISKRSVNTELASNKLKELKWSEFSQMSRVFTIIYSVASKFVTKFNKKPGKRFFCLASWKKGIQVLPIGEKMKKKKKWWLSGSIQPVDAYKWEVLEGSQTSNNH